MIHGELPQGLRTEFQVDQPQLKHLRFIKLLFEFVVDFVAVVGVSVASEVFDDVLAANFLYFRHAILH